SLYLSLEYSAEDESGPQDVVLADIDVRRDVEAPPGGAAGEIERVVECVIPLDVPQLAGDTQVTPFPRHLVGGREVGNREAGLDARQLDAVGVDALVAAGARTLERDHESVRRGRDWC